MQFNWSRKGEPSPNYQRIAFFYDYLMRHVNYARWFEYLNEIFNRHLLHQNRLLEIACGTGIMLKYFLESGWQAMGFDRSLQMVELARRRLVSQGLPTALWVGDMRQFALKKPVDAIICLYDSINYCLVEEDLIRTFSCVYEALSTGGVFVFDVVTQRNCRRHFRNFYEKDSFGNMDYIRQSYYDADHQYQVNEFYITEKAPSKRRYFERHVQRIYPLHTVETLLRKFQWELLGCFDNFSRRPGTEKADRVHFVLRK